MIPGRAGGLTKVRNGEPERGEEYIFRNALKQYISMAHTATVVLSPGYFHILQLQPVFYYNIDSHK